MPLVDQRFLRNAPNIGVFQTSRHYAAVFPTGKYGVISKLPKIQPTYAKNAPTVAKRHEYILTLSKKFSSTPWTPSNAVTVVNNIHYYRVAMGSRSWRWAWMCQPPELKSRRSRGWRPRAPPNFESFSSFLGSIPTSPIFENEACHRFRKCKPKIGHIATSPKWIVSLLSLMQPKTAHITPFPKWIASPLSLMQPEILYRRGLAILLWVNMPLPRVKFSAQVAFPPRVPLFFFHFLKWHSPELNRRPLENESGA